MFVYNRVDGGVQQIILIEERYNKKNNRNVRNFLG